MATAKTLGGDIYSPFGTNVLSGAPSYKDHQIKGKLISVELKLDETTVQMLSEPQIKADLARKLAEQLLKQQVVNFTKQAEIDMYNYTFRAYLYVTPSGETEIIRKYVKGTL